MIVHNSIKQMSKTPVKTILFLLLFMVSVLLVSLGGSLWYLSMQNIHKFEGIFTTIATVEQKPTGSAKVARWDWESEAYQYGTYKSYGKSRTLKDLQLDGVEYLTQPEKRPYYSAYTPEYSMFDEKMGGTSNGMVVEATPEKDCIPAGPVKMIIKNVLYSYYHVNEPYFYFCDHYNENPEKLYANKTYIMSITQGAPHHMDTLEFPDWVFEYVPLDGVATEQADKDGNKVKADFENASYQEVTENFYNTDAGKRWLALCKARDMGAHSVAVTATSNTNTMLSFYTGDAFILEGKDFSKEDYQLGNKVCLVSRKFCMWNSLKLGDKMHLALRSANYAEPAIYGIDSEFVGGAGLLNAKGEVYPVFEESDYTIVGIYDTQAGSALAQEYRLHDDEIVVPKASIKNSDENNILRGGRMSNYTTSFQIPNGDIDKYQEAFSKAGINDIQVTFYDKGYSRLESGLLNMKRMALSMLIAGSITSIFVLLFFCNMLIIKQRKRTAVERSLGMTKNQCTWSLLSGILLVALIGSLLGSIGGTILSHNVAESMTGIERYNREFSAGKPVNLAEEDDVELSTSMSSGLGIAVVSGLGMFAVAGLIAVYDIRKNLRCEPLELLSSSE